LVDVLADLGDSLVIARWVYVDDETLAIGRTNNPPIRESRVSECERDNGHQ
jgi:hypothetical protein